MRIPRAPPGNRLEALKGERKDQHAIRINAQYRVCFHWTSDGAAAAEMLPAPHEKGRISPKRRR